MNSGGGKYFWRWRSGFTTLLQLASTTTSKLPLRIASYHGPVGTTRWVTCSPILLHSSINHVPTNLYGWSMLRFRSSNASLCVPKIRFCNIGGEGRQGQVVRRRRRSAQSRDGEGRPCSEIDGFSTHYNRRHIRVGSGAGALCQTRSCGRDIRGGSSR